MSTAAGRAQLHMEGCTGGECHGELGAGAYGSRQYNLPLWCHARPATVDIIQFFKLSDEAFIADLKQYASDTSQFFQPSAQSHQSPLVPTSRSPPPSAPLQRYPCPSARTPRRSHAIGRAHDPNARARPRHVSHSPPSSHCPAAPSAVPRALPHADLPP